MTGKLRTQTRTATLILAVAMALSLAADARAAGVILRRPPGGGIIPVGDPVYYFSFQAEMLPQTQLLAGDSITIYNMLGVSRQIPQDPANPGSGTDAYGNEVTIGSPTSVPNPPGGLWSALIKNIPVDPADPNVYATFEWPAGSKPQVYKSDVTFYLGPNYDVSPVVTPIVNASTTNNLDLGIFTIATYLDLPSLGDVFSLTFDYTVRSHDLTGAVVVTNGSVTLDYNAVPEPASMFMLTIGVVGAAAWAARRRRAAA